MKCILSVDVEDWFHILDLPSSDEVSHWDSYPSRLEANFLRLLDIFSSRNVRTTCFFLGWAAEKFPALVREADARGHEVASHGYCHRLLYHLGEWAFLADVLRSKKILEDIVGKPVIGHRSSGFSVTDETPWFFDRLIEAGFRYDSSVFPAPRGHGGLKTDQLMPYVVKGESGELVEFPITVKKVLGKPICFFGGGYLRLFPYWVVRRMSRKVLKEGRPVVFYVHPREIDPGQPRLPMSLPRRFKTYVNLGSTERKLRGIMKDFELTTFRDYISADPTLQEK